MPKPKSGRKTLFRAALVLAGHTQESWARECGITAQHLSLVLNGHRESGSLNEKIDDYTRAKLGGNRAQLAGVFRPVA